MAENSPSTIAALLRVLSALVIHATDAVDLASHPHMPPVNRSAVQARVREAGLIDLALLLMHDLPRNLIVQQSALKFLAAVTESNVQNIVAVGTARNADSLRLVLRAIPTHTNLLGTSPTSHDSCPREQERRVEMLCTLCDLVSELSRVRNNFDALLSLGLTSALVEMLDTIVPSLSHVKKALALLERAVRTAEAEGKKAYAQFAASAVVTCMQQYRHNPIVQEAGIRVLVALMETLDRNRESACEVFAVQAVHYAVTEHSKHAAVMAVSCAFLLQLSPLHLMRSNLVISDLKKVVRARFKIHKENEEAASAIEKLALALDLVSSHTIRSIQDFLTLANTERNSVLSGGSAPTKRLLSHRTAFAPLVTGSFRKSFHRRTRQYKSIDDEAIRRRRVRSDFSSETTVERHRSLTGITRFLHEVPRPTRGKNAKMQSMSPWMEPKDGWYSSIGDDFDGEQRPDDPIACDSLIEILAGCRDAEDAASSFGSSRSSGGRLPTVLQAALMPPKSNIQTGKREPLLVVQSGKHREFDSGRNLRVEKRVGPIGASRGKDNMLNINALDIDAVDSTSGKSDMDVGEEDSLFSLSNSDLGSFDDDWEADEGYSSNYPRKVTADEVHEEETTDTDGGGNTMTSFEGATVRGSFRQVSDAIGSENSFGDSVNGHISFDVDEHFTELDEGNTDSEDSQNVVSLLSDALSNGTVFKEGGSSSRLLQKKYGERERIRSDTTRNSGSFGAGLWPSNWVSTDPHRNSPIPRMQTRGESGSLGNRRKTTV